MDNALCGGAGATLTGAALASVKAAIFMGDPHNIRGLPYNVGTCQAQGVSTSPSHHISIPSSPNGDRRSGGSTAGKPRSERDALSGSPRFGIHE